MKQKGKEKVGLDKITAERIVAADKGTLGSEISEKSPKILF